MPMLRMYADNTLAYGDIVANLPDEMKDAIRQGGPCKRLATLPPAIPAA